MIYVSLLILALLVFFVFFYIARKPGKGSVLEPPIHEDILARRQKKSGSDEKQDTDGDEQELVDSVDETIVETPLRRPSLRERLTKTQGRFSGFLSGVFSRSQIDTQTWDDLEEALIGADVGVALTQELLETLQARVKEMSYQTGEELFAELKALLKQRLESNVTELHYANESPSIWLFVGVNGVGKTTTIGKIAAKEMQNGKSVVLAAGDTFRAAAAEQLTMWAERSGADIIRGAEGADPSAIIFDAVQSAAAKQADLVLADTAGRLHTKVNLMEELRKIRRVAEKEAGTVTEVLLVLDATTGQNGLIQAEQFLQATEVTGVVLTKLDGSAKGGIVLAITQQLHIPIKLIGLGEGIEDLIPFNSDEFVEALFANS